MIRPISLSGNSAKEIELALNRLIREISATSKAPTISYAPEPTTVATQVEGTGEKGEKGDKGDQGIQGVAGPIGPAGPQGLPGNLVEHKHDEYLKSWINLATGWSTEPTLNKTIASGDVYNYVFKTATGTATLYRLVPSGSADDAFYSTFSNDVLSNLVATKPITI